MSDAAKMMRYDASKKSTGVAYLLWFFLGGIGAHRFYVGRVPTAVAYLVMHILGWLTMGIGLGFFLFFVIGVWWVVDAFLLPGMLRSKNLDIGAAIETGRAV